jgi:hypothetical protein
MAAVPRRSAVRNQDHVCANDESDAVIHWHAFREPDTDAQRNAEHERYSNSNRDAESEPDAEPFSHADAV